MRRRDEPDYASYDSYLRDQLLCPDCMGCMEKKGELRCKWCQEQVDDANAVEAEPE